MTRYREWETGLIGDRREMLRWLLTSETRVNGNDVDVSVYLCNDISAVQE
jgi:hypothetical protein